MTSTPSQARELYAATSRSVYIGKRDWRKVKELSLKEGISPKVLMGRMVREALSHGKHSEKQNGHER